MSCPHQFLTDFKKILDFVFFPLGLSIFGVAAWLPIDKGQSSRRSAMLDPKDRAFCCVSGSLLNMIFSTLSRLVPWIPLIPIVDGAQQKLTEMIIIKKEILDIVPLIVQNILKKVSEFRATTIEEQLHSVENYSHF